MIPPAPSTIDLHTHTRRSDGVLEPAELVAQAAAAGVRLLAITDHDSLGAYREVRAASPLTLLPGVEINAVVPPVDGLWESELHVLGFGMDPDDPAFEAALVAQREERRVRFERILARLRALDLGVDTEVAVLAPGADDALGRPTVARALVARGHATSVEDAFQRLLGRGLPAYVPRGGLDPGGAIRAIRAAGGLPVLAHFRESVERIRLVRELVGLGLGGLEVYYRSWDRPTVEAVESVARELRLVATGGTDYHGDLGPYAEAHAALSVPPEVGVELGRALASARGA
ncbi:MAG TPA: PHP domain-containing protein [Candidatus Limnocylindrales bacterium]|nr:PHP domain-containing protein [Candidatus Limnocylindrales bacterium]